MKNWSIISRWKAKTPLIFKRIIQVCLSISGIAISIHGALAAAGAEEPAWFTFVYPYLVGVPAGMASVAKITQTYDHNGNPVYEDDNDNLEEGV